MYNTGQNCTTVPQGTCLKKNLNASKHSNKMFYVGTLAVGTKNSTWNEKGSSPMESHKYGRQYNIGEKLAVTLYTYISHRVGATKQKQNIYYTFFCIFGLRVPDCGPQ